MREAQLLGDRYRLVERLGEGGMSLVWRGHDEVLGRDVAVKVLTPRFAEDRTIGRRLRVEAQSVARLCHPHITAVYDYGESASPDGATVPYVVMELVDGEPLAARLADGGLPWRDAVIICAQVAAALATAHANGIVHRDVTPANVMLTSAGAKVVDFGISALAGESDVGPDGSLFGTPAYLAPERLDSGPVEPANDVYGLGVLLYKALAGRLPWPATTTVQMLKAHRLAEPAPLPPSVAAQVPPEVVELCRRCLAKQPRNRPASDEVAQKLADAVQIVVPLPTEGPVARPAVAPADQTTLSWPARPEVLADGEPEAPRRRHAIVVLAALALITLAVWAGTTAPVGGATTGTPQSGAAPAAVAPAASVQCRVDYQVREDWGSGFRARLAVTNQGPAELRDWRLAFAFASDQRVTGARSATWVQSGRTVVTRPTEPTNRLDPGDRAEIGLTGSYAQANPVPVSFDLDGSPCQTVVLSTAVPSSSPTTFSSPGDGHGGKGKGKRESGKSKGKRT